MDVPNQLSIQAGLLLLSLSSPQGPLPIACIQYIPASCLASHEAEESPSKAHFGVGWKGTGTLESQDVKASFTQIPGTEVAQVDGRGHLGCGSRVVLEQV